MSGLPVFQRARIELRVILERSVTINHNQGSSARIWSSTDLLRAGFAEAEYELKDRLDCYNEWLLTTRQWLGQWAAL